MLNFEPEDFEGKPEEWEEMLPEERKAWHQAYLDFVISHQKASPDTHREFSKTLDDLKEQYYADILYTAEDEFAAMIEWHYREAGEAQGLSWQGKQTDWSTEEYHAKFLDYISHLAELRPCSESDFAAWLDEWLLDITMEVSESYFYNEMEEWNGESVYTVLLASNSPQPIETDTNPVRAIYDCAFRTVELDLREALWQMYRSYAVSPEPYIKRIIAAWYFGDVDETDTPPPQRPSASDDQPPKNLNTPKGHKPPDDENK
jgi:hypothetical protein